MNSRQMLSEADKKRLHLGFRVMQGDHEFPTYPRNATVRVWYQDHPDAYPTHFHPAVEMLLIQEGAAVVTLESGPVTVRAGEVMIIPAGMRHGLEMGEGSRRFLILFEVNSVFTMKEFSALRSMLARPFHLTEKTSGNLGLVRAELMQVLKHVRSGQLRNLHCYAHLLKVYALLGEEYLEREAAPEEIEALTHQLSGEDDFSRALTYVDQHFTEDLDLDTLAAYAGFSRYTLSRMFRAQTGKTFTRYLSGKRVAQAMELLTETDLPVTQIGLKVGFGSIASFNRVFREERGCTPSQFRDLYARRED